MPAEQLARWRGDPADPEEAEALVVVVGGVEAGGLVLAYDAAAVGGTTLRCSVRALQTTIPDEAAGVWAELIATLADHARARGAVTLITAVPPDEVRRWSAAGFRATMTTVGKRLGPEPAASLQQDRRVEVRPMDRAERERFVADAAEFLRAGMVRAGALTADAPPSEVERRLDGLVDPPEHELLMTGTVDGEPVGRVWMTLLTTDGVTDAVGNTLDLSPEHRGRGLTPSLIGAMARHVRTLGVRDVRMRTYAHDADARRTLGSAGLGVAEVVVRLDLTDPSPHPEKDTV